MNKHEPHLSHTPTSATSSRSRPSWKTLEQQIARVQKQIVQASQRGDKQVVHRLQQQVLESEAARLLAVHRVAEENQGRHTAGIDGVKSLTASAQLIMAAEIHPRNWKNQPSVPARRVWIPKPGTDEQRPLAILPMIDRCKQALAKMALEPEWETRFEAHSYGFRPNRSAHDALAAILVVIERRPAFVFNADIEKAFDEIDQEVILNKLETFPFLRETINTWLKTGVIDGGIYFPSTRGIPQGGSLSPLLLNIALHGMETVVINSSSREQPLLVRYADNFVILHSDLERMRHAIKLARSWLASLGLHLNARKTHLTHTLMPFQERVGFDFLGFHVAQEVSEKPARENRKAPQGRTIKTTVTPSEEASQRHLLVITQRLQRVQAAPQAQVIAELNPLIAGWASYYNGLVEATILNHYDDLLEQQLLTWASQRHPGKNRDWLFSRYWQRTEHQLRVFANPAGVQLRRYQHANLLSGEQVGGKRGKRAW